MSVTCPCGKPGRNLNGGLCDGCLDEALRATWITRSPARKLARRLKRQR